MNNIYWIYGLTDSWIVCQTDRHKKRRLKNKNKKKMAAFVVGSGFTVIMNSLIKFIIIHIFTTSFLSGCCRCLSSHTAARGGALPVQQKELS